MSTAGGSGSRPIRSGGGSSRRLVLPELPAVFTDKDLMQYFESVRRLSYGAAMELSATAGEIDAALRTVSQGLTIGGLTNRRRAHMVARQVVLAGEAAEHMAAYMVAGANRFRAGYMPEIEAAGGKKKAPARVKFTGDA